MPLSPTQLEQVRRMVADVDSSFFSNEQLLAAAEAYVLDDGSYDLRGLAASLWEERAADYHILVRTAESGSTRDMQQKFDHAMAMAKRFSESGSATPTDPDVQYPRSTRMVRPVREA